MGFEVRTREHGDLRWAEWVLVAVVSHVRFGWAVCLEWVWVWVWLRVGVGVGVGSVIATCQDYEVIGENYLDFYLYSVHVRLCCSIYLLVYIYLCIYFHFCILPLTRVCKMY